MTPLEILEKASATFRERNVAYGDNYKRVGPVMMGLFPNGITLNSEKDFERWHLLELIIVKLTRYAVNFKRGGHADSLEDNIVYHAMLLASDEKMDPAPFLCEKCDNTGISSTTGGDCPQCINPRPGEM